MDIIKTKDLHKGDSVLLRNGLYAEILEGECGNTHRCMVYGVEPSIERVYSHNIMYQVEGDVYAHTRKAFVEHTPIQCRLRRMVNGLVEGNV